jgi:hypothetical protein
MQWQRQKSGSDPGWNSVAREWNGGRSESDKLFGMDLGVVGVRWLRNVEVIGH